MVGRVEGLWTVKLARVPSLSSSFWAWTYHIFRYYQLTFPATPKTEVWFNFSDQWYVFDNKHPWCFCTFFNHFNYFSSSYQTPVFAQCKSTVIPTDVVQLKVSQHVPLRFHYTGEPAGVKEVNRDVIKWIIYKELKHLILLCSCVTALNMSLLILYCSCKMKWQLICSYLKQFQTLKQNHISEWQSKKLFPFIFIVFIFISSYLLRLFWVKLLVTINYKEFILLMVWKHVCTVCVCASNLMWEATCRWQQPILTGQTVIRRTTSRDWSTAAAGRRVWKQTGWEWI